MSELRRNPATGEWVIIAAERGQRPRGLARPGRRRKRVPAYVQGCPFCPGNEELTPQAILEVPARSVPGRWQVRGFPNKYPALVPAPASEASSQGPLFVAVSGEGAHEILVETPLHNRFLADMEEGEFVLLIQAYRERYRALESRRPTKYVLIFKNQGREAGTSLEHPHSQIIATPVVPASIQRRCEIASEHYDRAGRCLYCHIVDEELRLGDRVVYHDSRFVVFHPFAAARPAETWIVPMKHQSSFGQVDEEGLRAFASVLGRTLRQLSRGFGDPDFNYAIHSAPRDEKGRPYYHWHLQLMPRLTRAAGLELGSGIYVNVASPEDTAEAMRRVPV
ncbi:MAG: galactose-1-phosphate uridylyltransferase [Dehalococcoidia bacterium]